MKFITIEHTLIVPPEGEAIFHEAATKIELDNESAGCFVVVSQEEGKVKIAPEEWPEIRAAIDRMIALGERLDKAE